MIKIIPQKQNKQQKNITISLKSDLLKGSSNKSKVFVGDPIDYLLL